MATKSDVLIPLAGVDFSSFSKDDLKSMYRERLAKGLHGISFSPYIEGQQPGTFIPEEQIRERLKVSQAKTTHFLERMKAHLLVITDNQHFQATSFQQRRGKYLMKIKDHPGITMSSPSMEEAVSLRITR